MVNPLIDTLLDKMQNALSARAVCKQAEEEQMRLDSDREFHLTDMTIPPAAARDAVEEYEEAAKEFHDALADCIEEHIKELRD